MLKKGETRCWCLHHGLFFLDIFPELCIVHDMQVFPLLQHLTRSVCSWALVDMFFMGLLIFVHFSCFIFRRLVDKTRKISSTSSMSSLFSFETKKIINNNTTLSSSQLVSFRIEQINNFLYFLDFFLFGGDLFEIFIKGPKGDVEQINKRNFSKFRQFFLHHPPDPTRFFVLLS